VKEAIEDRKALESALEGSEASISVHNYFFGCGLVTVLLEYTFRV